MKSLYPPHLSTFYSVHIQRSGGNISICNGSLRDYKQLSALTALTFPYPSSKVLLLTFKADYKEPSVIIVALIMGC